MPPRQREQTYFGYAFEAWSTTSTPAPPDTGRPVWGGDVNTNEQWCVVVKTRLGPERLVLGGEVDCVQGAQARRRARARRR
jgi:RAT1-interacting protein